MRNEIVILRISTPEKTICDRNDNESRRLSIRTSISWACCRVRIRALWPTNATILYSHVSVQPDIGCWVSHVAQVGVVLEPVAIPPSTRRFVLMKTSTISLMTIRMKAIHYSGLRAHSRLVLDSMMREKWLSMPIVVLISTQGHDRQGSEVSEGQKERALSCRIE